MATNRLRVLLALLVLFTLMVGCIYYQVVEFSFVPNPEKLNPITLRLETPALLPEWTSSAAPSQAAISAAIPTSVPSSPAPSPAPLAVPLVDGGIVRANEEFENDPTSLQPWGHLTRTNGIFYLDDLSGMYSQAGISRGMGAAFLLRSVSAHFDIRLIGGPSNQQTVAGLRINDKDITLLRPGNSSGDHRNLSCSPGMDLNGWNIFLLQINSQGELLFSIRDTKDASILCSSTGSLVKSVGDQRWYPDLTVTNGDVLLDTYQELELR